MIDAGGVKSFFPLPRQPARPCIFEYIYFARPDSIVHGRSVYDARKAMGAELAREAPADADVVVPVPDSGVPAAIGYARGCGLPFELGIIRNHYVGRTFIQPTQSIRELGVRMKHNPNRAVVAGKRVVLIDDSIVRGTTSVKIVADDARGGGARGAFPHLLAADRLSRFLRHRHAGARQAARRPDGPREHAPVHGGRQPGVPVGRRASIARWVFRSATRGSRSSPTIISPATIRPGCSTGTASRGRAPAASGGGGVSGRRGLDSTGLRARATRHVDHGGQESPGARVHSPVIRPRDRGWPHSRGAEPDDSRNRHRDAASRFGGGQAASRSPDGHPARARDFRRARRRPVLHGLFDKPGYRRVRRRTDDDPAVRSARRRAADRARLRVRQRLPRHRQRRRDRHLHPRPAGAVRRRLVGLLEPHRGARVERRRRLRHRLAAAGRTHHAGGLERRLRDGVRLADRRDHLEPRHMALRHPGLELAHADRLDRRRRRHQRAVARPGRHRGRRLGPGDEDRRSPALLAAVRFRPLGAAAPPDEGDRPGSCSLQGARGPQPAADLDPRPAHPDLHAGVVLPRFE